VLLAPLLWSILLVILFLHTLRIHQTASYTDRIALVLAGLAAVVMIVMAYFRGPAQAAMMAVAGVLLSVVLRPLAAKFASTYGEVDRPTNSAERERLLRLSRGDISLDEYFREGHEHVEGEQRRLAELAMKPEISKVLRKHGVSVGRFVALRESLALVPELEWQILSDPRDLEQLILRVAAGKSPNDIALAFRGRRRSTPAGS
jgi:hypothetical protein